MKSNTDLTIEDTLLCKHPQFNQEDYQDIIEQFEDPLTYEIINHHAAISPRGDTYKKSSLKLSPLRDPIAFTKENKVIPLLEKHWRKNILFENIYTLLTSSEWKNAELFQLLTCPLSHTLFKDPVVAKDGRTYEKSFIENYLKDYDGKLPTGKPPLELQDQIDFYPNLFVINFIKITAIAKILAEEEKKLQKLKEELIEYGADRVLKPQYTSTFSYLVKNTIFASPDRKIKLETQRLLIAVIDGKIDPIQFLSEPQYQPYVNVLFQGTLKKIGKHFVEELMSNENFKFVNNFEKILKAEVFNIIKPFIQELEKETRIKNKSISVI